MMFPHVSFFQLQSPLKSIPSPDLRPLQFLCEHLIHDLSRLVLEYCQVHSEPFDSDKYVAMCKGMNYYIFDQLVYTCKSCPTVMRDYKEIYDPLDRENKMENRAKDMFSKRTYYSHSNKFVLGVMYTPTANLIILMSTSKILTIYNKPERQVLFLEKFDLNCGKEPRLMMKICKWINKKNCRTSIKVKLTIKHDQCWNGARIKTKMKIIEEGKILVLNNDYSKNVQGDIMSRLSFNTWRKKRDTFEDYQTKLRIYIDSDNNCRRRLINDKLEFRGTARRYSVS